MAQPKLNFRFHDPNPADVAADHVLRLLVEANHAKLDASLQNLIPNESDISKRPSA